MPMTILTSVRKGHEQVEKKSHLLICISNCKITYAQKNYEKTEITFVLLNWLSSLKKMKIVCEKKKLQFSCVNPFFVR